MVNFEYIHEVIDIFNLPSSPGKIKEKIFSLRSQRLCGENNLLNIDIMSNGITRLVNEFDR